MENKEIAKTEHATIAVKPDSRLKEHSPEDFKRVLLQEVLKVHVKAGVKMDKRDIHVIVDLLFVHLQEEWPGIKAEWLALAFKHGVIEDYGNYFGKVNFVTFVRWIRAFKAEMKRADYVKTPEKVPTSANDQITDLYRLAVKNPDKLPTVIEMLKNDKSPDR